MRWFKRISLTVVTLLLITVVGLVIFFWYGDVLAEREIELLRARGEPVTAEELTLRYRAGVEHDTTEAWQKGLAELKRAVANSGYDLVEISVGPIGGSYPMPGEPWPKLDDIDRLLELCQPVFQLLTVAADMPGEARFPLDFSKGIHMPYGHLTDLREAQRMLFLGVYADLHRGRGEAAIEKLNLMMRIPKTCAAEPSLFSQLNRIALDGMTTFAMEAVVTQLPVDDACLNRWQTALEATDYLNGIPLSMRGERVIFLTLGNDLWNGSLATSDGMPDPQRSIIHRLWERLLSMTRGYDLAFGMQIYNRWIEIAAMPHSDAVIAVQAIDVELKSKTHSRTQRFIYQTTLMFCPATDRAIEQAITRSARAKLLSVALAVERYRRSEGKLPERLAEIVPRYLPELPLDPWGSAAIRYRVDAKEFVLWWPGPDGVDDEGRRRLSDDESEEPDLAVRIRLP